MDAQYRKKLAFMERKLNAIFTGFTEISHLRKYFDYRNALR